MGRGRLWFVLAGASTLASAAAACVDDLPAAPTDGGGGALDGATSADTSTTGDDATGEAASGDAGADTTSSYAFTDPCTTTHSFCCNFDTDAGLNCLSNLATTATGSLSLATSPVLSPPKSLHSKGAGAGQYGYGRVVLSANQSMVCTFDLFVGHNDDQGNVFALYINNNDTKGMTLIANPDTVGNAVALTSFAPQVNDAGADIGPGNGPGKLSIPFGQWVRVQVSLVAPAVGNMIGDMAVLSQDAGPPLHVKTNFANPTSFGAAVGLDYVKSGTTDLYIDNVACDVTAF